MASGDPNGKRRAWSGWLEPWSILRTHPHEFIAWFAVVIVVGLVATWLPVLLFCFAGTLGTAFEAHLYAGTLSAFLIPVLAEGLVGLQQAEDVEFSKAESAIRSVVGTIALLLVIVSAGVMVFESALAIGNKSVHVFTTVHLGLAGLCIIAAAYLYCFRHPEWKRTVDEVKKEEDEQVDAMAAKATTQSSDGKTAL